MVAGAVLLMLGFIGLAFGKRTGDEAIKEIANENEQGRFEFEAEPTQTQAANRKAMLAEQTRERWANRGIKEDLLMGRLTTAGRAGLKAKCKASFPAIPSPQSRERPTARLPG